MILAQRECFQVTEERLSGDGETEGDGDGETEGDGDGETEGDGDGEGGASPGLGFKARCFSIILVIFHILDVPLGRLTLHQ
ncbi:MAG: hypothetical protein AB2L14_04165 [Candidatus Xenobiia bacterium LiM19]